jgi:hypothetical protein
VQSENAGADDHAQDFVLPLAYQLRIVVKFCSISQGVSLRKLTGINIGWRFATDAETFPPAPRRLACQGGIPDETEAIETGLSSGDARKCRSPSSTDCRMCLQLTGRRRVLVQRTPERGRTGYMNR